MKKSKLVMVGNGMAGVRTIEELIKVAPELYDITVFGAEPHPNYNRILLSPVLAGEQTLDEIVLNPLSWYEENHITLHLGRRVTDINRSMLERGRDRLIDAGELAPAAQCDAEKLPFAERSFDGVTVAFGLRNMTHKDAALAEMARVLRPGGRLLVLEFSKPAPLLQKPYDWYSFSFMPMMGRLIAGDAESYRYLAESIRMHPDQAALKAMMQASGFAHVDVHNLAGGIVALHVGVKC